MKYLGFLVLALVVGLASLGVSYSAWTERLTIGGNVNVGTWNAVFYQAVSSDDQAHQANDPITVGTWSWPGGQSMFLNSVRGGDSGRNYAYTNVVSGTGTTALNVEVRLTENTDYTYTPSVGVLVKNTGTVPIKVTGATIAFTANPTGATAAPGGVLVAGSGTIQPGKSALGWVNFNVPAHSAATSTATITLAFSLWNK